MIICVDTYLVSTKLRHFSHCNQLITYNRGLARAGGRAKPKKYPSKGMKKNPGIHAWKTAAFPAAELNSQNLPGLAFILFRRITRAPPPACLTSLALVATGRLARLGLLAWTAWTGKVMLLPAANRRSQKHKGGKEEKSWGISIPPWLAWLCQAKQKTKRANYKHIIKGEKSRERERSLLDR